MKRQVLTIPNGITLLRFLMIPFCLFFYIKHAVVLALLFFLFIIFTDFLDGFLARRWNQVTFFGKLFDPLVDKVLTVSLLYIFFLKKLLYPFFIILLLKELLLIFFAVKYGCLKRNDISASFPGKLAFFMTSCFFVFLFLFEQPSFSFQFIVTIFHLYAFYYYLVKYGVY